jgi:hypothetical protein
MYKQVVSSRRDEVQGLALRRTGAARTPPTTVHVHVVALASAARDVCIVVRPPNIFVFTSRLAPQREAHLCVAQTSVWPN